MGIFDNVFRAVEAKLPEIYADENVTTSVTWKLFQGSQWDDAQGFNVETFREFAVTAIRCEKQAGFRTGGGYPPNVQQMATGDVVYMFQSADLPAGISVRDLVVDGDLTYQVDKIVPCFGSVTKVEVKGYA